MVEFDPSVGSEMQKTRPAVVINPETVGRLPLRIVVPVTEWKSHYEPLPWFVEIAPSPNNGLTKLSGADGFQVRSLSVLRFRRLLGALTPEQADDVASAVAEAVGAP
jgi:mRNA interferase MazF